MKRRILSLLLVLSMMLFWVPSSVFAAESGADGEKYDEVTGEQRGAEPVYAGTMGENATYTFDPNTGELVITGSGDIARLDDNVSNARSLIKKVYVESGITGLGEMFFWDCENLTEVYLPEGLTELGEGAFCDCTSLESITLPSSATDIGKYAFCRCTSLKSVTLPAGLWDIAESTFYDCTSLESITLPDGVRMIRKSAFYGCTSLKSVTLSAGLTQILDSAFSGCTSLESITLPDGVTTIWESAFLDCTSLKSVTLSAGLEQIWNAAFCGCTSLERVTVPDGVTLIGNAVFSGCTSLESVTLPDSVTTMWSAVFLDCTSLESVTLPAGLTGIVGYTFRGCTGLENITIPDGVTEICASAFEGCTSLKNITLPDGVTTIWNSAFYNCTSLESITIPATVPELGDSGLGFYYNDKLGKVKKDSLEICGHTGSAAEAYAEECGFTFHAIHFYDDGVVTKAPTATEQGEKTYTCKSCGQTRTETVAVLSNPFTDLVETSAYYDAVLWAVEKGITTGTDKTHFSPKTDCTRAQIITFLWRYAGEPEPTTTTHNFVDIVEDSSYYKAVLWAVEEGITTGADSTHFNPKGTCTRAQIVTFLWRYAGKPQPSSQKHSFTDLVKESSYYDAVLWAVEKGITTGADSTHFNPKKTCTRAQGMTFLYRYNNNK